MLEKLDLNTITLTLNSDIFYNIKSQLLKIMFISICVLLLYLLYNNNLFSLDFRMMEFQKVKRYYSLFKLFIRLLIAFVNPFHELWMDGKVFKVWDLGQFYLRFL